MTATVKAVRSQDGYQLDVWASVLPCRRTYAKAAPAHVRLIADTGSSHTHLRLQALAGVAFKRTRWVGGLGGHRVPAMAIPAHLIFDGQLLTADVLVIDSADGREDGLIGLDLLRGMELRDGQASLRLARGGAPWRSAVDERLTAEDCGCWRLLRQSVKDDGVWVRTGF